MKALVIYDSSFGNTERVAHAIGSALGSPMEVSVLHVGQVAREHIQSIECLIVGSPTQRFRPTTGISSFLKDIPPRGLHGLQVAAFDTRLTLEDIERNRALAFFVRIFGYAARPIANQLRRKGGELVLPPQGFYVQGMEGPLVHGELERAQQWGSKIVERL